jgi:class 3 adenylate cyclase
MLEGSDNLMVAGDSDAIIDEIDEFLTGARQVRAPDRVLATVMFTDIVDSTRRASEMGDRRWRELLERHDELVRRKLDYWSGREIKTTGDGFLATFDGPARAIQCAKAIAYDVNSLGVAIRAGLHTGECEVRGDDVAGMAVHIGARVGSMAGPGEVLVSSTVKDLVVGSGIDFSDHGEHELKGVPASGASTAWSELPRAGARAHRAARGRQGGAHDVVGHAVTAVLRPADRGGEHRRHHVPAAVDHRPAGVALAHARAQRGDAAAHGPASVGVGGGHRLGRPQARGLDVVGPVPGKPRTAPVLPGFGSATSRRAGASRPSTRRTAMSFVGSK